MRGFRGILIGPIFAFTACASTPHEAPVVTRDVLVPIATKCAISAGPDPIYADSPAALLAAPDILERVRLIMAGRAQRMAREIELKAANDGCR